MLFCKAKGEVLDVVKSISIHPNCYTDITIKITSEDSFSLYKGKIKNKEGEGQKSSSSPYSRFECDSQFYIFSDESDLPLVGDNVVYDIDIYRNISSSGEENSNIDNICGTIKGHSFESYPFYNKCNLTGKIKDIHRKELTGVLGTHLKIDTGDGYHNVKTIESFYYGRDGYGFLGHNLQFPKLLKWGGVRFFKKGDSVNYIVDKDSGEILKEGYDESLEACNISNQKLSDFKFEGGLTPMQVVNLNMKKYREYKGIEEPKTQEEKQENQFIVGFKFVDYSGGLMISLFMLLLFFTAVLKNFVSKEKLAFKFKKYVIL